MRKQNLKLYLIFIAAFLVLHFTGLLVTDMPYIINAVIVFVVVLLSIFLYRWLFRRPHLHKTILK